MGSTGFSEPCDDTGVPATHARVLHLGEDYWHRVQVLRGAGMCVEECRSIHELTPALRNGPDLHAVLLAESPIFNPAPVAEAIRSTAKCAVILFSTTPMLPDPHRYDLVIHPLTNPIEWLDEVQTLIRRKQQECAGTGADPGAA